MGHLILRASPDPSRFHPLWIGALGLGHTGSGEDTQLPARVALLHLQVIRALRLGFKVDVVGETGEKIFRIIFITIKRV